ncbi:MAG: hypothetical protein ACRD9L_17410 [Bryobacteraceae bacterium]
MRTGRSEALDLLGKWRSDRTPLRVDFSFDAFAACFRGRVVDVSGAEVRLVSDDGFSEFGLRFKPDLEFAYGEPRDFPDEAESMESTLLALFPPSSPGEPRDFISFTELKET